MDLPEIELYELDPDGDLFLVLRKGCIVGAMEPDVQHTDSITRISSSIALIDVSQIYNPVE